MVASTPKTEYTATKTDEIEAAYTNSGNHSANSVDYWWVSGVNKGDLVLLNIQISSGSLWDSVVYYSNLTVVQGIHDWGTHIYEFFAAKTDNYLVRITDEDNFNYTIESTHLIDAGQRNATQVSFALLPNPTDVGKTVTLQGSLTSNGNPLSSAQVTIKLGVNPVGTLTTNTTGWFKASGSVGSAGSYNITVEYAGSEQYLPSANWTILVVKEATKIYCRIDPNPVNSGSNYIYEGILVNGYSQPLAGAAIQLYNRTLTGSWTYMASVTTDNYGVFRWQGTASVAGTFLFAAYYAGSATRESSYNYAALVVQ
jgi:hypothetical protein